MDPVWYHGLSEICRLLWRKTIVFNTYLILDVRTRNNVRKCRPFLCVIVLLLVDGPHGIHVVNFKRSHMASVTGCHNRVKPLTGIQFYCLFPSIKTHITLVVVSTIMKVHKCGPNNLIWIRPKIIRPNLIEIHKPRSCPWVSIQDDYYGLYRLLIFFFTLKCMWHAT